MVSDSSEYEFDEGLDPEGPSVEDLHRFGDEFTRCASCGYDFYDQSSVCPNCGHLVQQADKPISRWVLLASAFIVILLLIGLLL